MSLRAKLNLAIQMRRPNSNQKYGKFYWFLIGLSNLGQAVIVRADVGVWAGVGWGLCGRGWGWGGGCVGGVIMAMIYIYYYVPGRKASRIVC